MLVAGNLALTSGIADVDAKVEDGEEDSDCGGSGEVERDDEIGEGGIDSKTDSLRIKKTGVGE